MTYISSYVLSKSTFIRGLQCQKSLYLNKFRPYLRDKLSAEQLEKFARGHAVGKIAQQLFPGGIELSRPSKASQEKTASLINNNSPIIYEACFIFNDVIVALDILVKNGEKWDAYEVKSSTTLTETYYNDASLQYHVIYGSGLPIGKFYLIHRNPTIELVNNEAPLEAFIFTDVTEYCHNQTSYITQKIEDLKNVLQMPKSPAIDPGAHCMSPYPCDFRGVCWSKLSPDQQNRLLNNINNNETIS